MVGPQVELEGNAGVAALGEVGAHPGAAVHQVVARVVLLEEVNCELSGAEFSGCAHDHGEELLLECEPAQLRVDAALSVASVAYCLGLLVAFIVIVELGVLRLVPVALLHPRHGDVEVDVEGAHVAGDHVAHAHEREQVVHAVAVFVEGVLLLDVSAAGEGETHRDAAVGLLGELEGEVVGAEVLAGVDADCIVGLAWLEEIERGAVVVVVVLDHHGVGLRAPGVELHSDLAVLYRHDPGLSSVGFLYRRILVCGHDAAVPEFFLLRHVRHLPHGIHRQSYRVGLCLQFRILARAAGLKDREADENQNYEEESYYCVLVHL